MIFSSTFHVEAETGGYGTGYKNEFAIIGDELDRKGNGNRKTKQSKFWIAPQSFKS